MGSTDIFLSGEGYGVREVKVSPMVVLNVLDHFTRRAKGSSRVIGTLLGRVTSDNLVEVVSSFPVPHSEDMDEVAVDIDYHKTMYDLHKRVESGEEVVGWYATGANTEKNSVLIHEFYGRECANPVHILVDAELISDKADVRGFVSTANKIDDLALSSEFRPVPVHVSPTKADKVGLDMLHRKVEPTAEDGDEAQNAAFVEGEELLNLERSLEKLLDLLAVMGESVDEVLRGEKVGDPAVGRLLEETIANVTFVDVAKFRTLFGDSMRDLLMVVYLSKLTQTQLYIAEKLLCVDLRM